MNWGKLLRFCEEAVESNRGEAQETRNRGRSYDLPPEYWMGRAEAYRNIIRRIEGGEFDE